MKLRYGASGHGSFRAAANNDHQVKDALRAERTAEPKAWSRPPS